MWGGGEEGRRVGEEEIKNSWIERRRGEEERGRGQKRSGASFTPLQFFGVEEEVERWEEEKEEEVWWAEEEFREHACESFQQLLVIGETNFCCPSEHPKDLCEVPFPVEHVAVVVEGGGVEAVEVILQATLIALDLELPEKPFNQNCFAEIKRELDYAEVKVKVMEVIVMVDEDTESGTEESEVDNDATDDDVEELSDLEDSYTVEATDCLFLAVSSTETKKAVKEQKQEEALDNSPDEIKLSRVKAKLRKMTGRWENTSVKVNNH